jgi:Protein of unknown function (DUF2948)
VPPLPTGPTILLKLIALDVADVPVLSMHLQDAVVKVSGMAYSRRDKRFALICNRYNWTADDPKKAAGERRQSALRVERVLGVQRQGIDLSDGSAVLSLLAVTFKADSDPSAAPAGHIELLFASGGTIRVVVECVEMALEDQGPAWQAVARPQHSDG